jgi:hypothetical protein
LSRANIVLDANGCPALITDLMSLIAKTNPDSINMKKKIKDIKDNAQLKGYCK